MLFMKSICIKMLKKYEQEHVWNAAKTFSTKSDDRVKKKLWERKVCISMLKW